MEVDRIKEKLQNDPRNKEYTNQGIPPVFQVNAQAKILIVGQAPGTHVQKSLIPFHDRSGQTLMRWMGIEESVFYSEDIAILPMDFYYPGKGKTGDLPPRSFVFKEYHRLFLKLMPQIECTILTGRYAMEAYLQDRMEANLTLTVQHYRQYLPQYFPIVHPSPLNFRWHKKNPWFEQEVVPALQKTVHSILKV